MAPRIDISHSPQPSLLKALLSGAVFLVVGLLLRYIGAPPLIAWPTILLGAVGLPLIVYRMVRPLTPRETPELPDTEAQFVVLRDGREYRVVVTDEDFALTHLPSGAEDRVRWDAISMILLVAIDSFPLGSMSYLMVPRGRAQVEVPTDSAGNREFLDALQRKFAGFDNRKYIEAMGATHGYWELWPPR